MSLLVRQKPLVGEAELNRRHLSRYGVQSPVTFAWNEGENEKTGVGWTRDVNGDGAYIYSTSLPPVGATARVQVILPPFGESGRVLSICMNAAVLRVDLEVENSIKSGFAVQGRQIIVRGTRDDLEAHADGSTGT